MTVHREATSTLLGPADHRALTETIPTFVLQGTSGQGNSSRLSATNARRIQAFPSKRIAFCGQPSDADGCIAAANKLESRKVFGGVETVQGSAMGTPVAMVPLAKGAKVSLQMVLHHFVATWPRLPRPMNPQKTEQSVSFMVGGSTVTFRIEPLPIPGQDFQRACRETWFWPNAREKLEQHPGHVVISVDSRETRLNQIKFLSLATTSLLLSTPESLGVYWCGADIVVSPEMFRDFCVEMLPDSLPLYIWVDFRVSLNDSGKAMGYTNGLSQFGLMELETLNSPDDLKELRERFFSVAVYLIENGLIVKNGDFLDDTAAERIRVVYGDSSFGHLKRVLRLEFDSLSKVARKR